MLVILECRVLNGIEWDMTGLGKAMGMSVAADVQVRRGDLDVTKATVAKLGVNDIDLGRGQRMLCVVLLVLRIISCCSRLLYEMHHTSCYWLGA